MTRRRELLVEMLLDRGRLSVEEMAACFEVTGMTIRRDLDILEEQGLLTRTHGGCVLRTPHVPELPFQEKEQRHRDAKEAIARAVVGQVLDGSSLYLDTGTTCAMVARLLRQHRRNLRVFTNNLPAAFELFGAETLEVVIPGGVLGRCSPDLTGDIGLTRLLEWHFDLAIVGGDALNLITGEFFAADLATAALSRAAQRQADCAFACIDGSKFDQRALAVAGRLQEGTTLFTDGKIPVVKRRGIRKLGTKIILVRKNHQPRKQG